MPVYTQYWEWEEAFDKFGFGDGDGMVMTDEVIGEVEDAGYQVTGVMRSGIHNTYIYEIKDAGGNVVYPTPDFDNPIDDDPRHLLPPALVAHLDQAFSDSKED